MIIKGQVVSGAGIGRQIGYPTANIAMFEDFDMPSGVYAAVVTFGGQQYSAIANLGVRPTVSDGGERTLEVHLLGFSGDLYGQELTVKLDEFIRPERKFASRAHLASQIEKDKQDILKTNG
ncbi:MAG: riboflavin kinase [Rikenellaceae bacterium]|jgi:riboflavin kinase/FMN adenylyltransferase|nr:riboflavin kinase [Rikenellaceae bacterium]